MNFMAFMIWISILVLINSIIGCTIGHFGEKFGKIYYRITDSIIAWCVIGFFIAIFCLIVSSGMTSYSNPSNRSNNEKAQYVIEHNLKDVSEIPNEYPKNVKKYRNLGKNICKYTLELEGVCVIVIGLIYKLKNKKRNKLNRQLKRLNRKIEILEDTYDKSEQIIRIIKMLKETRTNIKNQINLLAAEEGISIAKEIQISNNSIDIQNDIDELEALISLNKKE